MIYDLDLNNPHNHAFQPVLLTQAHGWEAVVSLLEVLNYLTLRTYLRFDARTLAS